MNTGTPREEEIRRVLARVLASGGFARNERLSQFLRFLVERHLEGRDGELKESVLAFEVFGRKADYDPKIDAVVRTEAIRLRARLEKYYQGEGSQDPLIIELPKGGYRPVFRDRPAIAEQPSAPAVPPGTRLRPRILGSVATALILVALGATWWWTQATPRAVTIGQ